MIELLLHLNMLGFDARSKGLFLNIDLLSDKSSKTEQLILPICFVILAQSKSDYRTTDGLTHTRNKKARGADCKSYKQTNILCRFIAFRIISSVFWQPLQQRYLVRLSVDSE